MILDINAGSVKESITRSAELFNKNEMGDLTNAI